MIINTVRLRNFRSHADTEIEFGSGINLLLGDNGAGKTSILEAISFALFKDYSGNLDNLVKTGSSEMGVEIVFTSHGRKYRVERKRKESGSTARLFLMGEKEELLREGDSGVDREIEKILGMDRYLFTNAVYVRQGEIARLLTARPSEKKQLIGRLLGIDILERVWERMRTVIDVYRDKKSRAEGEIARESEVKRRRKELEDELGDVEQRIEKTKKGIGELSRDLEKLERQEKKVHEIEKKHVELRGSYDSVKAALEKEKERHEAVKRELKEIERSRTETGEIEKRLKADTAGSIQKKLEEKRKTESEINEKIGTLKGKALEIADFKKSLEGARGKCPLCGSALTDEHRGQLLRERSLRIEEAEKEKKRLLEERKDNEKEIGLLLGKRDAIAELEKRLSALRGIAGRYDSVVKSMESSEKLKKELSERLESIEKMLRGITEEKREFSGVGKNVSELRSELGALKEARGKQRGKFEELESALGRLEKESGEIEKGKEEHRRLSDFLNTLNETRSVFDKSGLQRELRIRSGPMIESHMKDFFGEFDFDYSDLSLDENYEVTLYGQGGKSVAEMISGGEKIAVALSMRLGIARTLAGSSAESMLLDEPTIFLDSERRRDLIEVLKKLSTMPQLIVVSHDGSMEEAADRISMVKKERGVSSVDGT